jgi:vitamin B12 transporter
MNLRMMRADLAVAILLPIVAQAQTQRIEEITIVGARVEESIPQDLSRYGNRVEVITGEQIARQGYIDASQALQMLVPGLHLRPKNGQFDYFDASLQGSRNAEILWLIDGVRITNRLYNGTSPLDTVPAHMIERIEILKGGQGIFYGTQSVGGVINIVTRSFTEEGDGEVSAGANTNEGYALNAYYRGGGDNHRFVAYASRDEADGYQPWRDADIQPSATDRKRGYEVSVIGLKYAFDPTDDSRLSLQYQHTDNSLDFARPYLNYNTVNERDEEIVTVKYDWEATDNLGLFIKAYGHDWDTEYTRIYNTLDGSGNVTGELQTINDRSYWGYDDYGLNAMAKLSPDGPLEYVFGIDYQSFSGSDDVWRIADQAEDVTAAFTQLRTTPRLMENTTLALGIRENDPSNAESATVWNISGKHDFTDRFYIRGNVGTSFRLPDAEALFLNEYYDDDDDGIPDGGWFAIGNPNLKPERSENVNIAIGGRAGMLDYELIRFDREITDYIASYVPLEINGVVGESFVNSDDKVQVDGFEFIAAVGLGANWAADFSYTSTDSELNGDGIQLTGIPESEFKVGLTFGGTNLPVGFNISIDHVGDINARRGEVRGDYTVLDFSAFFSLGPDDRHQISLRLENATDEEYSSRVDLGTVDSTGTSYVYDNLGMTRTLHASYTLKFQ